MKLDWKKFFSDTRAFVAGALALARDIWNDPLAHAVILWLMRKWIPGAGALATHLVCRRGKAMPKLARPSIQSADDHIRGMGLYVPEWFWNVPQATRDRMCNGMGPDAFGERLREMVNGFGKCVIWCSFVHDPAFYLPYNDGTRETWQRDTQDIWEANSAICVEYANRGEGLWTRIRNKAAADIIVRALRLGAYAAYRKAFERGARCEAHTRACCG